jgi:hypothetical protein
MITVGAKVSLLVSLSIVQRGKVVLRKRSMGKGIYYAKGDAVRARRF